MRQIWRQMEMIHPTIGWRRYEQRDCGFSDPYHMFFRKQCIICPALCHGCLTLLTLCYIDSRFFLPLEQSCTALLGCRLTALRLRKASLWQLRAALLTRLLKKLRALHALEDLDALFKNFFTFVCKNFPKKLWTYILNI